MHFDELIENIDIGGPSMIRSAAKNFQDVAVVTSPADYDAIAEELSRSGGALSARNQVAAGAKGLRHHRRLRFRHRLDARDSSPQDSFICRPQAEMPFPQTLRLSFQKTLDLRYGENPHQKAAMYSDGSGAGVANARQLQGKELSYNNIVDLQAAWDLAQEFDEPVVRHHQAHQSLRNRDRQDSRRGLQAGPRMRSRLRLRRRDRREPPHRRRGRRRNAQAFPRSHRRSRLRRSRQSQIRLQEESPPRRSRRRSAIRSGC